MAGKQKFTEMKRNSKKTIKLIQSWIKEDTGNSKLALGTWGRLKKRLTEQGFINLACYTEPLTKQEKISVNEFFIQKLCAE